MLIAAQDGAHHKTCLHTTKMSLRILAMMLLGSNITELCIINYISITIYCTFVLSLISMHILNFSYNKNCKWSPNCLFLTVWRTLSIAILDAHQELRTQAFRDIWFISRYVSYGLANDDHKICRDFRARVETVLFRRFLGWKWPRNNDFWD